MTKKGTSSFIVQRLAAVLLFPLAVWFLFNVVSLAGSDYETARAWFSNPLNGCGFAAYMIIAAVHMRVGMMEIVLDYVSGCPRAVLLSVNRLLPAGIALLVLVSVYLLSFAG